MIHSARNGTFIVLVTFGIALLLSILPLPEWARLYRPQWLSLVLIYWCLALPHRYGVGTGFIAGLTLDVLTGTLLGQHALGMSIIAYITVVSHQRVRVFPFWQQAIGVLSLVLFEHLLSLWVMGIANNTVPTFDYWIAPAIDALLWPWVYVTLRDIHHRFKVM